MTTTVKLSSSGLVKVTGGSETTIIDVNETYATSTSASDAQSTATAASTSASDAQSTATAASTTASNAQSTATAASTTASNAQSTATAVSTTASNAQSTATAASTTASNAQSTATAASTTASNAQSTVSAASTTASNAQSTATAASTTASNAQSTANAASTTASNAQSTANAANNILTNGSRVHCFAVTDSTSDSTLTEHDSETTYSQKNYIFPSVDTQGIIIFENTTNIDRHLTTTGTSYVIHNEFSNYNRLEQNCHVIFVSKENNLNWRKLGTIRKTRFIDLI